MPFSAAAAHPLHLGQAGPLPAAEKIANAIVARMITETPAATRPGSANGPSYLPPWVNRPHGAPKTNAP